MLSMPLVTIENLKSGHYLASAFEDNGKFYVGKKGITRGFMGTFVASGTEDKQAALARNGIPGPVADRDAWLRGFNIPALTDRLSDGMNQVGGNYGNQPQLNRADGQILFDNEMANALSTLGEYAWWAWHLDYDITQDGAVVESYYNYDFAVLQSTIEYLGRVDGDPYHFGSLSAAQQWIDINIKRDAQTKPKTGKALARKLQALNKYHNRVQASLNKANLRTYSDPKTKYFVTNALTLELAEVGRRYGLEESGGA
ncbi:hypothetical protein [Collimonas pratensis]|uniref:Uncharacterized protein n=1 Tax=Collimonas pratensis TaxID=279113 RepID=A0ABN4M9E0_9BURK|nr:hypothetical protein [Collimonas pratensis]AMP14883.1 hypothetical protein CPter291_2626 [Collimonas pratensis]